MEAKAEFDFIGREPESQPDQPFSYPGIVTLLVVTVADIPRKSQTQTPTGRSLPPPSPAPTPVALPHRSRPRRKSDLGRQPEGGAEHALRRRHIPHIVNHHLPLPIHVLARPHAHAQLPTYPLADIQQRHLIIALERKAVRVNQRELPLPALEQVLVPGVETPEIAEELDGRGGQVHDEVVDRGRERDDGRLGRDGHGPGARRAFRCDCGGFAAPGGGEDVVGRGADEGVPVGVEGADELGDLVSG